MVWKDWPFWLKGGLVGIFIYFLFIVFMISVYKQFFDLCGVYGCMSSWIILFSTFPINFLYNELRIPGINFTYSTYLAVIIQYFLIGALIGWVIGKIKSK